MPPVRRAYPPARQPYVLEAALERVQEIRMLKYRTLNPRVKLHEITKANRRISNDE